jgi:hypothetical protein
MKKFEVIYFNAIRKTENTLIVLGSSLESVRNEETKAIEIINQFNPFISVKSITEVN